MLQYFPAFRRIELQMRPAPPMEDEIESEEEEEAKVKKLSVDDVMRDTDSEEEEELPTGNTFEYSLCMINRSVGFNV